MFVHLIYTLLILNSITQIVCQDILISTNYTKSYLSSSVRATCKQNMDCPMGSVCKENLCKYESLLCYEEESINCVVLNETIWDPLKEEVKPSFKNLVKEIPIIKTCTIDGIVGNHCTTKKCYENSDCFSGFCYSGYCATKENIYNCKDSLTTGFTCRNFNNMQCSEDSDCSHTFCKNNYCTSYYSDDISFNESKNGIRIILIVLCTLYLVNKYKKKKETRRIQEEMLYQV